MTRRLAASLLIVLAAANIARADVSPVPLPLESPVGIAITVGVVLAGAAVSVGIVIGGVIWMRRRSGPSKNEE